MLLTLYVECVLYLYNTCVYIISKYINDKRYSTHSTYSVSRIFVLDKATKETALQDGGLMIIQGITLH